MVEKQAGGLGCVEADTAMPLGMNARAPRGYGTR